MEPIKVEVRRRNPQPDENLPPELEAVVGYIFGWNIIEFRVQQVLPEEIKQPKRK
jgi:hypothetical protein